MVRWKPRRQCVEKERLRSYAVGEIRLSLSYYPLFSLRAATILSGVFRITLSVSEGTESRRPRPLADAQGYRNPPDKIVAARDENNG